jgi:hypothetical protein
VKNPKKIRYLALRAKGTGTVEAADLVGVSRQTAWRWSRQADASRKAPAKAGVPNDHEGEPTHGDPRPPGSPGAKGQQRDRSSLRETLRAKVKAGVLDEASFSDVLGDEILEAVDEPEPEGADLGSSDLPPILVPQGGDHASPTPGSLLLIQGERRALVRSSTPVRADEPKPLPPTYRSSGPGAPMRRRVVIDESKSPDWGWGSV